MSLERDKSREISGKINPVTDLEDTANAKAALLQTARQALKETAVKYHVQDEHIDAMYSALEAAIIESEEKNQHKWREDAVGALRKSMGSLHLEIPGYRDDFLETLNEMMTVRVADRSE